MYQSVLVVIDFDRPTQPLLQRAMQLLGKGGEVTALAAVPDLQNMFTGVGAKLRHQFEDEAKKDVAQRLARHCERAGLSSATQRVAIGELADATANFVRRNDVDLVVFSCANQHGIVDYLGSLGVELLHHCASHLLAVVETDKNAVLAPPSRPLLAFNVDEHASVVAGTARNLFPKSKLLALHVVRPHWLDYEIESGLFNFDEADDQQAHSAVQKKLAAVLKKYQPLELVIDYGFASRAIVDVARKGKHDLIIMNSGAHQGWGWKLGSTAHNVIALADVDTLITRPRATHSA
jgi:nucleotide-binding universal stress UspA family protein